jgi:anhydro-N-acetylmuramic acid kinase
MQLYKVIGLMSGTSLDGVDIAWCEFEQRNNQWSFEIRNAVTIAYSDLWRKRLSEANNLDAYNFSLLNCEYGSYLGDHVRDFVLRYSLMPDLVASHGHTIFHRPDLGVTVQIGHGAYIAKSSGLPVVCDFRSPDVARGGEGAPLVPVGDQLLFSEYRYCLNLGGFGNISFDQSGERIAFDICPVNIVLNHLARKMGKSFDENGNIARQGEIDANLLASLNELSYYQKNPPKSLGREWLESVVLPILEKSTISTKDKIRTFTEHIAIQVVESTINKKIGQILVTGGGAHNVFLLKRIEFHSNNKIVIPDQLLTDYKEAMIFAFLGLRRYQGLNNIFGSVTGASCDLCSGAIYLP